MRFCKTCQLVNRTTDGDLCLSCIRRAEYDTWLRNKPFFRFSITSVVLVTVLVALHCQVYWSPWSAADHYFTASPEPKMFRLFAIWILEVMTTFSLFRDNRFSDNDAWDDMLVFFMAGGAVIFVLSMLICMGHLGTPVLWFET